MKPATAVSACFRRRKSILPEANPGNSLKIAITILEHQNRTAPPCGFGIEVKNEHLKFPNDIHYAKTHANTPQAATKQGCGTSINTDIHLDFSAFLSLLSILSDMKAFAHFSVDLNPVSL